MLQAQTSQNVVSAVSVSSVQMVAKNVLDPNQKFTYDPLSLRIYNPSQALCLKGAGSPGNAYYTSLTFAACDATDITQQFILTTSYKIYNPNFPNFESCLNGGGAHLTSDTCTSDGNEIFNVVITCSPGNIYSV